MKKLHKLEEEGVDCSTGEVGDWLFFIEFLSLVFEKLDALPRSLVFMKGLRGLKLSYLKSRGELEWPESLKNLETLEYLDLQEINLSLVPELPPSLETLKLAYNKPNMKLDLSNLNNLRILVLDGLNLVPTGIEGLIALENLSWQVCYVTILSYACCEPSHLLSLFIVHLDVILQQAQFKSGRGGALSHTRA